VSTEPLEGLRADLKVLMERARRSEGYEEFLGILAKTAAEAREGEARAEDTPPAARAGGADEPVPMRFGMVGDSPALKKVFELIAKVAPSDVSVLVHGETGTGKELVARALHDHSRRKGRPFMAENCAAVPANLLESELFGHKRGSFTGAVADRAGHFVAADGGSVFLDEIGDMPLEMQAKLLRVLQDGEVRPVGSNESRAVDVRVIAATNKDLVAMCKRGEFREDLYFRLNVITIELPPLRERKGDVRLIARWLLGKISEEMGRRARLSEEALLALEGWRWPGNVRELENEIRRAMALGGPGADGEGTLGPEDLSPALRPSL
jgi:transcriptional regulator with GAF, ATPase, and Fis domain